MSLRISRLAEAGTLSHEAAALAKAWNTLRGRECVALARELLGGNGILADFHVAKARFALFLLLFLNFLSSAAAAAAAATRG